MLSDLVWNDVYKVWRERAQECGLTGFGFVELSFNLPQFTGRTPELQWWPVGDLEQERDKLLAFWTEFPHAAGRTNTLNMNKGQQLTLELLWHHRNSLELQAAIVIAGYLYRLVGCSRPLGRYSECCFGLTFHELHSLFKVAHAKASESDDFDGWPSLCTEVLPTVPELQFINLKSIETVICYIAERNSLMMHLYDPVRITFD